MRSSTLPVDKKGFITALDQTNGELYQYDKLGNLIFISAVSEIRTACLRRRAESPKRSTARSMSPIRRGTGSRDFTRRHLPIWCTKLHSSMSTGKYNEAYGPWKQVLERDSNYDLAYLAIGKSLFRQHKYEESMRYFKLGGDRKGYSDALFEYRKVFIREHFGDIATSILVLPLR